MLKFSLLKQKEGVDQIVNQLKARIEDARIEVYEFFIFVESSEARAFIASCGEHHPALDLFIKPSKDENFDLNISMEFIDAIYAL